jgi:hypothetical protein
MVVGGPPAVLSWTLHAVHDQLPPDTVMVAGVVQVAEIE